MKRKALIVAAITVVASLVWCVWMQRSVGSVTGRVMRKDGYFGTITQMFVCDLPGGHGFVLATRQPGVTLLLDSGEELFVRTSLKESRACYSRDGEIVTVQHRPNWECPWYAIY